MNKEQENLVIACLFGDGYITKHRPKKNNPKLEIQHSGHQLDYLIWKRQLFIDYGFSVSKIYDVSRDKNSAYRFNVNLSKEDGIALRHHFYPNNNKTISRHDLNKLTPLGLAIWFMDDGGKRVSWDKHKNKCNGRSLHLATHSYTKYENEIIQQYFNVVWNVQWNIRRDGDLYYLSMNATNAKIFIPIISDYIIDSLSYKIDLQYKNNI